MIVKNKQEIITVTNLGNQNKKEKQYYDVVVRRASEYCH
jgi:hypothetical protein